MPTQFPFSFWKTETIYLPRVGPFVSLPITPINSLSDITLPNGLQTLVADATNDPIKYRNITLGTSTIWRSLEYHNIIWANRITGTDAASIIGYYGNPGDDDDGGSGTSGGGAGGAIDEFEVGLNGGSAGQAGGTGGFDNNGGQGYGQDWNTFSFDFGNGGSGGLGGEGNGSGWGEGGFGDEWGNAGGGGGGSHGTGRNGYGGGGGGPLIGIVCNELLGEGNFLAIGGQGAPVGGSSSDDAGGGGGGGGGVIWIAAKKYTGGWSADVSGGIGGEVEFGGTGENGAVGQARIYEITSAGILVLRAFNQSWDNT